MSCILPAEVPGKPPAHGGACTATRAPAARLTPRERQLVGYFAAGRPNKVVAIDFGISMRTAEAHRARIFRKLGVRSALELACALCPHRGAVLAEDGAVYRLAEPTDAPAPRP